MRIKTKLNLGIGILFILIVLLAFISIKQINSLASASRNIIKDNKESIAYARSMLKALSEIDENEDALSTFERTLLKQKSNITEVGEKELTEKLSQSFERLKNNTGDKAAMANLQSCLFEIMAINLNAVEIKNTIAIETANRSILIISFLSFFFFIIALILFIKLPGNISNPIKELINSIKLIAANDYSQRVNFEGHSELGELADSFKTFVDLDKAKTNFIATISHELKTPISAIKFSLQLLENKKTGMLNDEQRDLIRSCEEDTNILLKIISELINITQIETGNIQLSIMPSNLKDILQYAINTSKPLADQKKICFEVSCPDNLPEVLADKEKTAWVLTNIISNAIRYSNENSRIKISVLHNGLKQLVSVKDNGPGIDSIYKDKIFDRYFRVPGTNKAGTGLGLAISKEFIEAQGGQISVESELGIGSTFTIILSSTAGK